MKSQIPCLLGMGGMALMSVALCSFRKSPSSSSSSHSSTPMPNIPDIQSNPKVLMIISNQNRHKSTSCATNIYIHWEKIRYIGGGSFGFVSVARNRETQQLCAVKELYDVNNLKSAEFLRQEIHFLSQLNHPNIVKYYGSEMVGNKICLYMEYVEPGSLKNYIRNKGPLQESLVRDLVSQILSGLDYLHSRRIVHRDIKPDNILIGPNNTVKLADFGLAKHLHLSVGNHSVKGTKHYAAPEIIENKEYRCPVEASAADIWSLGWVIIEMFTGKHPWGHLHEVQVMFKVCFGTENLPIPEALSQEGKDFLKSCFIRSPAERPSAKELLGHPFVTGQSQKEQAMTLSEQISKSFRIMRQKGLHTLVFQQESPNIKTNVIGSKILSSLLGERLGFKGDNGYCGKKFLTLEKRTHNQADVESRVCSAIEQVQEEMELKLEQKMEEELERKLQEERVQMAQQVQAEVRAQMTAFMTIFNPDGWANQQHHS